MGAAIEKEPETQTQRIRLVFLFVELGKGDKPLGFWAREEDVETAARAVHNNLTVEYEPIAYGAKLKGAMGMARVSPGMIVEVDAKPEKDTCPIFPTTARYAGRWNPTDENCVAAIERWEARDLATREVIRAKRAAKAALDDKRLVAHVEAIRKSMKRMSAQQRGHILAWVVQELSGG